MAWTKPMPANPVVAVAGATGAVGREMLTCLEALDFPCSEVRALASARSAGQKLPFRGGEITVQEMTPESFEGVDIALFSAGASVSREKLSSLENELTKEALAKVKDKALLIQESLQMKGYHTQSLDVSSANDSANDFRPYAAGAMTAKSFSYSDEKDETYTQSGKEKIKVSVNARIALLKE